MNRIQVLNLRAALLAVTATVLLSGCGRDDPASLIVTAREYQAKGDHSAAIIQLKNVLQQQPENGEARLMLGRSTLSVGDPLTAGKEFRKALEYGQPASTVVPLIATAMLQSGNAARVISEFGPVKLDEPKADAELRARIGEAQLQVKNSRAASESFAAALATDPQSVMAQLGLARLQASEGKLVEAAKAVDAIVVAHPQSVDGLLFLAQLKLSLADQSGARAALKRAIEAAPANIGPRMHLISLLIQDSQFEAAVAEISEARAMRAQDLDLQFFEAQIALGKKDMAKARDLAKQVLKRAPSHVPASILLGMVALQEKHYVEAELHLRSAIAQAPTNSGARGLLATSYLASGQPAQAMEALRPVIDAGTLDPKMSLLVGETYLANGDVKQAARYFEDAAASKEHHSQAQTRLAQIALASGKLDSGVKQLEDITAGESAPFQADTALLAGYVRQGNTDKALEVAEAMVKKRPNDPAAYQALGYVLVLRKQPAAAKTAFSQALQLNPTYVPAAAALAQYDLDEKNPKKARERFEAILAKEPKNEAALAGLARVLVQTKAPASEIVAVLLRAIEAEPRSVNARLALIDFHLRNRDARAALAAAQEASAALDNNPRILGVLGRAQLEAGDTNQAIATFNRLATLEPQSPVPLLRLAAVYTIRKENEKAAEALLRAQKLAPANASVTRDLVAAYLRMGRTEEALKQSKAFQVTSPKSDEGFVLEGDAYSVGKQMSRAERAYREALKVNPKSEAAALKLYAALVASNRKAEADSFGNKWLADNASVPFRNLLAEHALRAGDLKTAVTHYEVVVAQRPNNAIVLNNLAWAMGQLGDPKALAYAERAVKLSPDNPAALDTYGVLLTSRGYAARGVEYLSRAVTLAPNRHDIRLNYAKALLKAGRKDEARKLLVQLEGVEQDFPGKTEVAGLLKQ